MTVVSIQGLDKAEVLASLYNAIAPNPSWPEFSRPLTRELAERLLESQLFFGWLHGRYLGVNLSTQEVDFRQYDDSHGFGAGAMIIQQLRENGFVVREALLEPEEEDLLLMPLPQKAIQLRRAGLL